MKIAKRMSTITASPTMAVMEEAQRLRKEGIDIIDLGPGEPDFPTPGPIKDAGILAIESNFTRYTASAGILELRQAVAERYNARWGTRFSAKNVVISCGAKHSIYNLCMAVFHDGDEVLVPAPYWVTFPEVVRLANAAPISVPTSPEDGFVLELSAVESAVTENTQGIIVNSPNNPTGAILPEQNVRDLVSFCRERNIFLLSDETYEDFVYEGRKHVSAAGFLSEGDDCVSIVGSMSKTFSMTGWRIGYCLANEALIKKIAEFQSHQSGNPTSVSQKAALAALSVTKEVEEMRQEYEARREIVLEGLAEIPGFSCPKPYGAFYAFPDVSAALRGTGIADSVEFARFLIREARVATVPGSAFGAEGFIRISYATSRENLREGLNRIKEAVGKAWE